MLKQSEAANSFNCVDPLNTQTRTDSGTLTSNAGLVVCTTTASSTVYCGVFTSEYFFFIVAKSWNAE